MKNAILILVAGTAVVLTGCASVQQASVVQRPGETARSGLEVPPNLGERPVQTAAALQTR